MVKECEESRFCFINHSCRNEGTWGEVFGFFIYFNSLSNYFFRIFARTFV